MVSNEHLIRRKPSSRHVPAIIFPTPDILVYDLSIHRELYRILRVWNTIKDLPKMNLDSRDSQV